MCVGGKFTNSKRPPHLPAPSSFQSSPPLPLVVPQLPLFTVILPHLVEFLRVHHGHSVPNPPHANLLHYFLSIIIYFFIRLEKNILILKLLETATIATSLVVSFYIITRESDTLLIFFYYHSFFTRLDKIVSAVGGRLASLMEDIQKQKIHRFRN